MSRKTNNLRRRLKIVQINRDYALTMLHARNLEQARNIARLRKEIRRLETSHITVNIDEYFEEATSSLRINAIHELYDPSGQLTPVACGQTITRDIIRIPSGDEIQTAIVMDIAIKMTKAIISQAANKGLGFKRH